MISFYLFRGKQENGIRKYLLWMSGGMFLASWLLPNHYLPWLAAYQDFAAFSAVFLLAVFAFTARSCLPQSAILIALTALIPVCQYAAGLIAFRGDTVVSVLYLIGFFISVVTGFNLAAQETTVKVVQLLAALFVFAGVLSVWVSLRQWLLLEGDIWFVDLKPGDRPFANFAQPNNFATSLCLALAGVAYLFKLGRLSLVTAIVLGFYFLIGLGLAQSRTTALVLFAVAVYLFFSATIKPKLLSPWVALTTLLMFVVVAFGLVPFFTNFLDIGVSDPAGRVAGMQRLGLYWQMLLAIYHGPIWGYGWNQLSAAQLEMTSLYPVQVPSQYAHNIVLDLLIWNGPIVGGLIISVAGLWLFRLFFYARSIESQFCALCAIALLTHGMLEYPLAYAFFLLPFGFLLGVWRVELAVGQSWVIPPGVKLAVLAVYATTIAFVWYEYRIIEEDNRLMRFEVARIGLLKAEQKAPDVVLLTQLREYNRYARTYPTADMSAEELNWMRQITYRYPYSSSLYRYGVALMLNNRPDEALQILTDLCLMYGDEKCNEVKVSLGGEGNGFPERVETFDNLLYGLP